MRRRVAPCVETWVSWPQLRLRDLLCSSPSFPSFLLKVSSVMDLNAQMNLEIVPSFLELVQFDTQQVSKQFNTNIYVDWLHELGPCGSSHVRS